MGNTTSEKEASTWAFKMAAFKASTYKVKYDKKDITMRYHSINVKYYPLNLSTLNSVVLSIVAVPNFSVVEF